MDTLKIEVAFANMMSSLYIVLVKMEEQILPTKHTVVYEPYGIEDLHKMLLFFSIDERASYELKVSAVLNYHLLKKGYVWKGAARESKGDPDRPVKIYYEYYLEPTRKSDNGDG